MEKEWVEQLTEAQKAKLKAMDGNITVEQLAAFCREEKLPLPDDLLEGAAGGRINSHGDCFSCSSFCSSKKNYSYY